MDKQTIARKRNWFKYNLEGSFFTRVNNTILTLDEVQTIYYIETKINSLKQNFEDNSRKLGLKVPEYRCWCGREGKYPNPLHNNLLSSDKVCYKHSK